MIDILGGTGGRAAIISNHAGGRSGASGTSIGSSTRFRRNTIGTMLQRSLRVGAIVAGAVCAIAVAISALYVAADYMGHESVPPRHWKYLAVSTLIAATVGSANAKSRPWFEWLAYGAMLVSATILVCFCIAFLSDLRSGSIPWGTKIDIDPPDLHVLIACIVVLGASVPVHFYLRRQIVEPHVYRPH